MIRIFSRYWSRPAVLSVVVEAAILFLSVAFAFEVRFKGQAAFFGDWGVLFRTGLFCSVVLLTSYFSGTYELGETRSLRELWIRLLRAYALSLPVLWTIYYIFPNLFLGRGLLILSYLVAGTLIFLWRVFLLWILKTNRLFDERLLIVGADEMAIKLVREILANSHKGYRVVGLVDDNPDLKGVSLVNPRVIGATGEVSELALQHRVSRVVVAQKESRGRLDLDALLRCKANGIPVERGSDFFERLTGKIAIDRPRVVSQLVFSKGFVVSPVVLFFKRILDVSVATLILVAALPVIIFAAAAIKLDSRGPTFFRQQRAGRKRRVFTLWKFRSMRQDAEAAGEVKWAVEGDPRVTRVGRILRKSRIDELPQLLNVLVGDMSLVGPRPERPEFVRQLIEFSPLYKERFVVRPGITGWAQIQAPYAASVEESLDKLRYDLYYIKNLSIPLDLSILASTVRTVFLGRGAR